MASRRKRRRRRAAIRRRDPSRVEGADRDLARLPLHAARDRRGPEPTGPRPSAPRAGSALEARHVRCCPGTRAQHPSETTMAQPQQTEPPQHQEQRPGIEAQMTPRPEVVQPGYRAAGKLEGKVALVTGGDSGIGRSVAVLYAKEGADVAIAYLQEHEDAEATKRMVEAEGRRCLLLAGDVGDEAVCRRMVERTVEALGRIDVLVNN